MYTKHILCMFTIQICILFGATQDYRVNYNTKAKTFDKTVFVQLLMLHTDVLLSMCAGVSIFTVLC